MKLKNFIKDIKYYLKSNKLSFSMWICLVVILSLGMYIGITFGRYVFSSLKEAYFTSNSFYFNCDKMTESGATYQLNNWSGADVYSLIFNMNTLKNNNVGASSDVSYTINYSCSSNVICSISKTSGTIYSSSNKDSFTVNITPNTTFTDGDEATLTISATSSSPYVKTLSAEFTLVVGKEGLSYEVTDTAGSPYLSLRITNTLSYYLVRTAFGSYSVNDRIDSDTYEALSTNEKSNCSSAIITLSFNPNNVVLDMTSDAYLNGYNFQNTTVSGVSYISQFSFKMEALSSEIINFYKTNASSNYTYPIVNSSSIINVTYS